jgi:FtsH-binding integral membrane protein
MEYLTNYINFIDKFWFLLSFSGLISSIFILGQDDGKLISYKGKVDKSSNIYEIIIGIFINIIIASFVVLVFFGPTQAFHVFIGTLLVINFFGGNKSIDTNDIIKFKNQLK